MKRNLAIIIGLLVFVALTLVFVMHRDRGVNLRVGLFLHTDHPIIEEIRSGIKDGIDRYAKENGRVVTWDEKNAHGKADLLAQIAEYFQSGDHRAVIVIGVPAAQALKSTGIQKAVIFAGPPDPVKAGLVKSLAEHQSPFTGTAYFPPVDLIVKLLPTLVGETKNIAVLRNPGETNSSVVAEAFFASAKNNGYKVIDLSASNAVELEAALSVLRSKKLPVFIPTDNFMYSNFSLIASSAKQVNVPIISVTRLAVEKGAAFSVATDYYDVGLATAKLALPIIFGNTAPKDVAVLQMKEGAIYVGKDYKDRAANIPVIEGYPVKVVDRK